MLEYLPVVFVAVIAIGAYRLAGIQERLRNTEAKLDALLGHLGVEWGKFAEPSDLVKELAKEAGSRIAAIKAYREQTGLDLKAAKVVIDRLARESSNKSSD